MGFREAMASKYCRRGSGFPNTSSFQTNEQTSVRKLRHFVSTQILSAIYRVSQEECAILRESVPYVKLYRYNPKHLYPKFNGYGDNDQRKVRTSCISAFCTPTAVSRATHPSSHMTACESYVGYFYGARAPPNAIRQYFTAARYANAWNPKDNRGY